MIPRKIHYCWFSGEPFPADVTQFLDGWKQVLPDYELILWNRSKAEATGIPWVMQALAKKKWAFAADAVRLYALETEGGIYLDTDVEVVKSFDPLMGREYFFGFENGSRRIEGAILAANKNHPAITKALDFYRQESFNYTESQVNELVLPNILANAFNSLRDPLEIFPEDFFSPKSFIDGKIRATAETYCIHHFQSNWRPESVRKGIERRQKLYKIFPTPVAKILSIPLALWTNLRSLGIAGTIKKIFRR
ncbi:MAG: glycosyltransferase [Fibrobacter sp.]|nr:glycosyltransferase [Fibrobacter sp.]